MMARLFEARTLPLLLALGVVPVTVFLLTTAKWQYAILPGLSLAALLVLGRRPQWGYYLIVFFIPLALFRTLSQSLTFSKLLGLTTVVVFLFYLLLNRKGSYDLSGNLWKWLIFFFLINLVSTLLSDYPAAAFNGMRQLLNAYVFFLLTLIFVDREGFARTVPYVIMAGNFIGSALSVIGHFLNLSRFSVDEGYHTEFIRSVGAETGPNDLAFVVLFSLPFFAALFFSSSSRRRRAFGGVGFAIGTAAIVLSYSRAGARILVLAVLLIAIEHLDKFRVRHLGHVGALVGAATLLLMTLTPESWWERQMSVSVATDSSTSRRASYLPVAFDAFLDNPLVGTGTQTFKEVWAETSVSRRFAPSPDGSYRRVAHNSYAEVLAGAGGAGFLVFLVIIGVTIRGLGDSSRRFLARGWLEEAAIARTYLTAFLIVLAIFLFLTLNFSKYFWLSLALSQIACRLSLTDEADGSSRAVAAA